MEIACVIDKRLALLATSSRPGRGGGPRPGRAHIDRDEVADPVAAAETTEAMVRALEELGAEVESEQPGEAFFAVDGLRGLYGGSSAGVLAAVRRAVGEEKRVATGSTRFAAFLAAAEWARPVAVAALRRRLGAHGREIDELIEALERLGIATLPAFARLSADQVSDRFGPLGLRALQLCRGEEEPLRPRIPHEEVAEEIELPEGTAGRQLDRALELLVDRLLAVPQRKGRTLLGLRLGALLAGGGSWSVEQGLGRPSASPRVLRNVLAARLEELPGPATALRLRAVGLGPPARDQLELAVGGAEPRRRRLRAVVREVRAAQGAEALLKILPVDDASRVPERWALLTPYPEL
jgi:protein ImuB